jgi:hypothetical protein
LFLDDDPARAKAFLGENPGAVWVQTVSECLDRLTDHWDEVHLDHDLGGRTFVDSTETDCGMEVIRWMCTEPRPHLRQTLFFVHTHNSVAGLLMVLQMRARGYKAEFRPFGFDLAEMLARGEPCDEQDEESKARPCSPPRAWLGWLRSRKRPDDARPADKADQESIEQV